MRVKTLLICALAVSVSGNCVLALLLVQRWSGTATIPQPPDINPAPERSPAHAADARSTPSAKVEFHWSQLEANDFAQYAANLRSAGFPEEAVQDAFLPLVLEHYGEQTRELGRKAWAPRWAEVPETEKRIAGEAWDQTRNERNQLLRDVFSMEEHQVRGYSPWQLNVDQVSFGNLEDSKRQRLEKMRDERAELRTKVERGDELSEKLTALISDQEAELESEFPEDILPLLRSAGP
jgi:hypothetical protein